MPINLDEIRKGRRRNWESLKDPEERREKLREEREKELQKSKQKSWMRVRDEERRNKESENEAAWKQSKRRVIFLISTFVGFLLLSSVWNFAVNKYQESARIQQKKDLRIAVDSGVLFSNFETPLDAWASWRSAYMQQNAKVLQESYSKDYLKRTAFGTSANEWIRKQTDRFKKGTDERTTIIAKGFSDPVFRYYPNWGQREGTLCVLQDSIEFPENYGGSTVEFVLALVYEAKSDSWKVEELRTSDAWRDSWTNKNHISRTQNPDQLRREEELMKRKQSE